ncbi:MAG: S-layer homology domain-containing protein [Waterburya sp.]
MSVKQNHPLAVYALVLASLLTLLSGCGNGEVLEGFVGADPELKKKVAEVSNQTQDPFFPGEGSKTNSTQNPSQDPDQIKSQDRGRNNRGNTEDSSGEDLNFPDTFPVYPQAELQETKSSKDQQSGMMLWNLPDNRQTVADYYLAELSAQNWEIIKPFTINPQQKIARAIAVKDNRRVELSLLPGVNATGENTQLSVVYHPLDQDIPNSSIAQWETTTEKSFQTKSNRGKSTSQLPSNQTQSTLGKTNTNISGQSRTGASLNQQNNPGYNSAAISFTDLDEIPPQLQQPIESVAALNILTPYTRQANVDLTKFAPNEVITRGEYARWLIAANNRYYADNPGKKIYLATATSQPAFNDVKPNHPDFGAIQSLAEAGLIPSRLTEDSTKLLFRPDAPLIRADLVTWKVPLDTRKSLPKASIQAIEESWGFQDAADIDSSATRALYADFQNGDRSNVRRMFGYTTLFQPKKPVTRAEAAASLWYFGFQGDGISAKEVLASTGQSKS